MRRSSRRGFTLIELMVAMAAGVLVAMAALVLSRNATKFFQSEARIAGAQISATLGMNRLATDLGRAGFLSTPNIQRDPRICGDRSKFTGGLANLAGLNITQGITGATGLGQSNQNGMLPDTVVLAGSFDTTEQFPIRYAGGAGPFEVDLQIQSGAFQRAYNASLAGGTTLEDMFRVGRYLRLAGPSNQEIYGIIAGTEMTGTPPTNFKITLENSPAIPVAAPGACGLVGLGADWLVNPVARVKYSVRSLTGDTTYGPLVAPVAGVPDAVSGDLGRTELVRVEIDNDDKEIAGTLELVAEFAVDLTFGMRAVVGPTPGTNPTLDRRWAIGSGSDAVYRMTDPVTNAAATPEHVRSVQVRLTTRARAPDRDTDLPLSPQDQAHVRMLVVAAPKALYARVRHLYAEVALMNQAAVTW